MKSEPVQSFEHMGISVRIEYDTDPSNPRTEWDNAGKMICWHRRYNLGDKHDYRDPEHLWASLLEDIELTDAEVRLLMLGIVRDPDSLRDYRAEFHERKDHYKDKAPFRYDFVKNWMNDTCNYLTADQREKRSDVINNHYVILPLYLYDHSGLSISTGSFSCPLDSGQVGYIFISNQEAEKEWPYHAERGTSVEQARKYLEATVEGYDQYLTGQVFGFIVEHEDIGEESCWGFYGEDYCVEEAKSVAEHMAEQLTELEKCSYEI